jgi:hypothetical protein
MPSVRAHTRRYFAALALSAIFWFGHEAAHAQPLGTFPTITAEALDKSSITLPAQLQGKENLLLLSWARDQAPQVETWSAVSQALLHTYPALRVYRIPVSDPENILFRWWDTTSLRTDETDPELLHWIVPIYTDKRNLRQSLNIPANDHQILVLLVDRTGRVLWRTQGPSTPASRQALRMAAQSSL